MKKIVAALSLLVSCASALATPVTFTNVRYTTTAFASAGAVDDGPRTDDFPTSALPLSTTAAATSALATASAAAEAKNLFLKATANASSVTDSASAGAAATFTANFSPTGDTLHFAVNFDSQSSGLGFAENLLAFVLIADGITVFNETFADTAVIVRDFTLPAGSFALLDLTLTSNADALQNDAFSLSSTDISLDVPEPSTGLLCLAGALALALRRPRNQT